MSQLQVFNKLKKNILLAKPFLKWVGGKTQLLEQFDRLYPQQLKEGKITKYFELFLGGGAVFFDIIHKYSLERVFLNDINQDLILAYKIIKTHPDALIELLLDLQTNYHQSERDRRKQVFYQIRQNYNQQRINFDYSRISSESIKRVSWLIFLNKTCFNGLYRTNQKGEFNVPFGRYKQPKICDETNILSINKILQKVTLSSGNYRNLNRFIDDRSFVYIDPPYRPLDRTSKFTTYDRSGFSDRDQIELYQYYQYLSENTQAKVMLSNSNPHNTDAEDNFFHTLYERYKINAVSANRMVNSNANKRGKITELVITNY